MWGIIWSASATLETWILVNFDTEGLFKKHISWHLYQAENIQCPFLGWGHISACKSTSSNIQCIHAGWRQTSSWSRSQPATAIWAGVSPFFLPDWSLNTTFQSEASYGLFNTVALALRWLIWEHHQEQMHSWLYLNTQSCLNHALIAASSWFTSPPATLWWLLTVLVLQQNVYCFTEKCNRVM